MERYDYREAMTADIIDYIRENISATDYADRNELEEALQDKLWVEDSVTGNASGSYTFNAWQAEEYLCHNLDLLKDACHEFDSTPDLYSPESCDVTIRCFLLGECIAAALDELEGELTFTEEEVEEG